MTSQCFVLCVINAADCVILLCATLNMHSRHTTFTLNIDICGYTCGLRLHHLCMRQCLFLDLYPADTGGVLYRYSMVTLDDGMFSVRQHISRRHTVYLAILAAIQGGWGGMERDIKTSISTHRTCELQQWVLVRAGFLTPASKDTWVFFSFRKNILSTFQIIWYSENLPQRMGWPRFFVFTQLWLSIWIIYTFCEFVTVVQS